MTVAAKKLKSDLVQLSVPDRAEIAHFLLQSLPHPPAEMTEDEFDGELDRRAAEIRQGKAKGEPAKKVMAELRAKF